MKSLSAERPTVLMYSLARAAAEPRPISYSLPAGYSSSIWSPSLRRPWPRGISNLKTKAKFLFRSVLHHVRLFASRECGAVCIHDRGRLVHYSGFTPRYWRFPFLRAEELQIGDTWTEPSYRSKGLAGFALRKIIQTKQKPDRRFWYLVSDDNLTSIHLAENAGFELIATGTWIRPLGIKLLGYYEMNQVEWRFSLQ